MVTRLAREEEALGWIREAGSIAQRSTCFRSKCGAIIVSCEAVIGYGFNSPPAGMVLDHCLKDELRKDEVNNRVKRCNDKTCCVHAEVRAILSALENKGGAESVEDFFEGSTMYFARLGKAEKVQPSGAPYCTQCSKMCLEVGIGSFVIWHKDGVHPQGEGIYLYSAREYHEMSLRFREALPEKPKKEKGGLSELW